MNNPDILPQALELAALTGWALFPCKADKKPMTEHGFKDATNDPAALRACFNRTTGLIGIACGLSGFFVLDIDVKNNVDGLQSLDRLVKRHASGRYPLVGPIQRTPSGGWHLFFTLPERVNIPNNAGRLAPGLDLRSAGYVCTGTGYHWAEGHGPDKPLTAAPAWLLREIANLNRPNKRTVINKPQKDPNGFDVGGFFLNKYSSLAQPGTRNNYCFMLACQLRDNGLTVAEAERFAEAYAARVPGRGFSPLEAVRTVRSAYNAQARSPMGE